MQAAEQGSTCTTLKEFPQNKQTPKTKKSLSRGEKYQSRVSDGFKWCVESSRRPVSGEKTVLVLPRTVHKHRGRLQHSGRLADPPLRTESSKSRRIVEEKWMNYTGARPLYESHRRAVRLLNQVLPRQLFTADTGSPSPCHVSCFAGWWRPGEAEPKRGGSRYATRGWHQGRKGWDCGCLWRDFKKKNISQLVITLRSRVWSAVVLPPLPSPTLARVWSSCPAHFRPAFKAPAAGLSGIPAQTTVYRGNLPFLLTHTKGDIAASLFLPARDHATFPSRPRVPIGCSVPTWQSLIGCFRWHSPRERKQH